MARNPDPDLKNLIALSTAKSYTSRMLKNELIAVLNNKNLVISDCLDTFRFIGFEDEYFILSDSNGDLYNFWFGESVLSGNVLNTVCVDSDAEFEFSLSSAD